MSDSEKQATLTPFEHYKIWGMFSIDSTTDIRNSNWNGREFKVTEAVAPALN